jgi:H+/Cl- antiporter ClcA
MKNEGVMQLKPLIIFLIIGIVGSILSPVFFEQSSASLTGIFRQQNIPVFLINKSGLAG